jgi:hypothetical protein
MLVKRFRDAPVPIKWFVALFHSGVRNCARRSGHWGAGWAYFWIFWFPMLIACLLPA